MVVIVIRAQAKDSGEELCRSRTSFGVENPRRVFESRRMPETCDERECFNESWPSSLDLGSKSNPETGKFEFANDVRASWDVGYHESFPKGGCPESRSNDFRLDSPASKDSGFSDKITPYKTKRIVCHRISEPFEETKYVRPPLAAFDNRTTLYRYYSSQVDPEDSLATTKEEEWITKKKIELTTTRQIETRVKRQVVLEDGKIVEDSGPLVTTNTTEDTEKQEHSQTEHRKLGDENGEENWVPRANPEGCVKEVQEKTVRSREETEERLETEDVQHLGSISDEGYMTAIKSGSDDFRQVLEVSNKKELVESQPKILHQSLKTKKFVDTEDKTERSQIQPGGKIINEIRTTRLHEELGDCNISDDDNSSNSTSIYESSKKENSQRYRKIKEQDVTEYLANGKKIGEKIHHQAETTEGERFGDRFDMNELDDMSSKLKKIRLRTTSRPALENNSAEILSKKTSTYDQEEEARKAETSKWLEYHFGSESTKSSKGSVEDLDEIVPSTQNSFISVTMKSQPLKKHLKSRYFGSSDDDRPLVSERANRNISSDNDSYIASSATNSYFQGIGPWSDRKEKERLDLLKRPADFQNSYSRELTHGPKLQPKRNYYDGTFSPRNFYNENHDSLFEEPSRRFQFISKTKSDFDVSSRSKLQSHELTNYRKQSPVSFNPTSDVEKSKPSPPLRKKQKEASGFIEKEFEARNRRDFGKSQSFDHEQKTRSPTPKTEETTTFSLPPNKKLYQRTRFAADIPPPQPKPPVLKQKSKIGESFRKFVGKLRSSSSDRKNKKKSRNDSRSPSPKENTYQNYNSLDNYGSLVDRESHDSEEPAAPPRGKYSTNFQRVPREADRLVQRYYLGEDPFSTSIYGREKLYEENKEKDRKSREMNYENERNSDFKSRTLGRFSKSTSRLINPDSAQDVYSYDRGGVQTLPRKFRQERNLLKQVNAIKSVPESSGYSPDRWKFSRRPTEVKEPLRHTESMINVSIVNQPFPTDLPRPSGVALNGPAKPARTYKSNLSRSQSFNVEPSSFTSGQSFKSKSHLHRLEEIPAPLESPGIISNWSHSSRNVNEGRPKVMEAKDKRTLFMKGLYDRAPELFKTLHGDALDEMDSLKRSDGHTVGYSSSFRSTSTANTNNTGSTIDASVPRPPRYSSRGNFLRPPASPAFQETYCDDNLVKTVSRSESSGNDDYSETVRINSKSDDPLNPSETNTIKIFSKKKIPLKNGHATETIESSETKTVVKSQGLRSGLESDRGIYNRSPNGVVIKVRNRN